MCYKEVEKIFVSIYIYRYQMKLFRDIRSSFCLFVLFLQGENSDIYPNALIMYLLRTGNWNLPRSVLEKCLNKELIEFVWEGVSMNIFFCMWYHYSKLIKDKPFNTRWNDSMYNFVALFQKMNEIVEGLLGDSKSKTKSPYILQTWKRNEQGILYNYVIFLFNYRANYQFS
jgi:hypothetical protein